MANGQWLVDEHGRWWFDSGALSLDFAYTGAMSEAQLWDPISDAADLGHWLAARFERVDANATARDVTDAMSLRSAVAAVAHAVVDGRAADGDDVDTINLFAATPDIPPVLAGGARQAGRTSMRPGQALATIARDAVLLFSDHAHDRLRRCAAADCQLIFFDESRSNNRRWCSMQRCGNRSKVRAHRSRAS
jgi:predicted RNA-binding Zn ribbon-like protein